MPRSSSSSSSSDSLKKREIKLMRRLQEERKKMVDKKKKQKELMKSTETLEEKRIRRLLKKEMKERKRKQLMGWDSDYLHYTNTDNPFGDNNLLSTFVWQKKLAKEGLTGVTRAELESRNRQKMEENRRELEKVKKRRLEREIERQNREEEVSSIQRSKEATQFHEWEQQEDEFHLEQARLRSQIRIQDGRAKPIDLLAKYICSEKELDAIEVHEPYTYLNGLSVNDLEDLLVDIKVYTGLEKGKNLDYWNDITIIVGDELTKLKKQDSGDDNNRPARRDVINSSVSADILNTFRGKSVEQLETLKKQIMHKVSSSSEGGVDVGYWESLLVLLRAHIARARLRERHEKNLKEKLESLKKEQRVEDKTTSNMELKHNKSSICSDIAESATNVPAEEFINIKEEEYEKELMENAKNTAYEMLSEEFDDAYDAGKYSPQYINADDLEPGTIVISDYDDANRLEYARMQLLGTGSAMDALTMEEQVLQNEARKNMTNEEAEFSVESILDNQVYIWSDKYRPRKPRYFNRVHTGFEWNKYNQTHYDMDNPPPKIVQGYKFNIFYPDLIDKSDSPEYFLIPCKDNPDFAILRFQAGPPYEDIAFKIVHREWEYSYKKGFRCQFQNNIFQLWFHFKRYRYRR